MKALFRFFLAGPVAVGAVLAIGCSAAWAAGGSGTGTPVPVTEKFSGAHSSSQFIPSSQPIYAPAAASTPAAPPVVVIPAAPSGHADTFVAYKAGRSTLANTGSASGPTAAIGGMAVLSGLGLVALSRRRSP